MNTRRDFLGKLIKGALLLSLPVTAAKFLVPKKVWSAVKDTVGGTRKKRYIFAVDTEKCVGCGFCVKACKLENDVPLDAHVSRTWIERYVLDKNGEVFADSPQAALNGFTDKRIDLGRGEMKEIKDEDIRKAFFVPKLCNQCENPPCVQVCPVGATYQTPDGVVLVDQSWCIGCGYCIMACPYGARFFHPVKKIADKCNFCYHRTSKGLQTACVQACPFGARQLGDSGNPEDPVTKIVMTERVNLLKEEFGTKPQAYYLHLSKEVR